MNFAFCLLFLGALSIINLLILTSVYLLDFANATSKQKIIFIRIGLATIVITLFIFFICQLFSYYAIKIILPDKFINQLPIHSILPTSTKSSIDWAFCLFITYTVGFLVALFRIVFSYLKSIKQLTYTNECRIQGHTALLSKNIQSPLSFGFPKAKIYLPFNIKEKWTEREIEMCLAHEQIHIDQNDILWKLLSFIVEALLFFAPWVYFLHRRFEFEMELFCDEKTRARTSASIHEYGNLLLTMTMIQPNNLIFTNIKTLTLKRRLLAMKLKKTHRPLLVSALSMILLFAGGTVIATSNNILMSKNKFKITSKIFFDGNLVSSPQIMTFANQKASITLSNNSGDQRLDLTLLANNIARDNIKINYDIHYHNGNEKIHTKPVMLLTPNQEGTIQITSDSDHFYTMKVIVERQ